jgi:TnpA family transposase
VFGLCALMGFEFTPRISDVLSRSLMTLGPKIDYGPASTLIKGILNPKPLLDHWDGVRHIAASIRHGTTAATTVMRKLAAYPRQNNVALGLAQVGMLEHTRSTMKYLRTESLRRQVQTSLNNGEAVNSLAWAVFFGRRGVMHDRAFEDQMHRASCLVVLIAAIAVWNTVYLAKALETYQTMQGKLIDPQLLEHLSPLGWNHINLLGRYVRCGPRRRSTRTPAMINRKANESSFSDRDSRTRPRKRAKKHASKGPNGRAWSASECGKMPLRA